MCVHVPNESLPCLDFSLPLFVYRDHQGFLVSTVFDRPQIGERLYLEALKWNGEHVRTHYYLAVLCRGQNRLFEARKHFLCAAQLSEYSHLNSLKDLGNLLRFQLQQPEQSKEFYLKCLDRSPSFSKALLQMATLTLELCGSVADLQQSVVYFRSAILSTECSHSDRRRAQCLVSELLTLCADLFAADDPFGITILACFSDFTSIPHPSPQLYFEFARFLERTSSFSAAELWFQSALVMLSAHVSLAQPELAAPLCGMVVTVYSRFRARPVSPSEACVASAFLARHEHLPLRPTRSQFHSWAHSVCDDIRHAVGDNAFENRASVVLFALDYLSALERSCSDSSASGALTETIFSSISALTEFTGTVLPEYLRYLMKDPANETRVSELFSHFFSSALVPGAALTGLLRDAPELLACRRRKERPSPAMLSTFNSASPLPASHKKTPMAIFGLDHSPDFVDHFVDSASAPAIPECRSASIPAHRRNESCVPYGCAVPYWRVFRLFGEFLAQCRHAHDESKAYLSAAEYLSGCNLHICHRRSRMAPCECRSVSAEHLRRLFGGSESAACSSLSSESL